MAEQNNNDDNGFGTSKKIKSPMYPYITFSDALSKAKLVYKFEKRAATTASILYQHLGYQNKTGSSSRVVSALKQYGLLDEKGGQYRISDRAYRLFNLPDESKEKREIEKELALRPRIFKEVLANFQDGLPSDKTLKSYLILDKGFNENGADIFIRILKAAISFANWSASDYNYEESFEDENTEGFEEEEMNGSPETNQQSSPNVALPPPIIDGTRVTIDISTDGEIKISYTGDVNMKIFQFVNGILELQQKLFKENKTPNENLELEQ